MDDVIVGVDGRVRCGWCGDTPDYVAYHDDEWGVPVRGDTALFERITLEAFQSGLSWLTILRKREAFRTAFAEFDAAVVARFDERDVDRLMADASIVRNRRKIGATITNARALVALQQRACPSTPSDEGSSAGGGQSSSATSGQDRGPLDALVWSFAPPARPTSDRPRRLGDLAPHTEASVALSKALKANGFVFVGPTTMHAAMQACGLIDDHLAACHRSS